MAIESVTGASNVPDSVPVGAAGARPHSKQAQPTRSELSEATRDLLQINNWVCDFEMHEALWQAQSILSLAGEALDDENEREVAQQAVLGAERILVTQIRRTGWEGMGSRWNRPAASSTSAGEPTSDETAS